MTTVSVTRPGSTLGRARLEIDVASGPAASYDGLRSALGALAAARATFGDLPRRYPAEWQVLWPTEPYDGRIALAMLGQVACAAPSAAQLNEVGRLAGRGITYPRQAAELADRVHSPGHDLVNVEDAGGNGP